MVEVKDTSVKTSYRVDDVILLLKDVTGRIEAQSTEERERAIQSGRHYCEMLPKEECPTKEYFELYNMALNKYAKETANAVKILSERIVKAYEDRVERSEEKGEIVLVSLARAGLPVGILVKHYIQNKYGNKFNVMHYGISIIRGKGIDHNAMSFLLKLYKPEQLQFIDGWTGKGAILDTLKTELMDKRYKGVSQDLAVLADPAGICELCGTREDFLIASSCLNSTVSGLISRTILRDDLIGDSDFHGAVYNEKFKDIDESYNLIHKIEEHIDYSDVAIDIKERCALEEESGFAEAQGIADKFGIDDITKVKPSIGECTRVLLRRVPWKVLVHDINDDEHIGHIKRLAQEKGVEVIEYPLHRYKAVGIVKDKSDI